MPTKIIHVAAELATPRLSSLPVEVRSEFGQAIDEKIGRMIRQFVPTEPVSHATTPCAGIARRLDVNFGIADKHGLFGRSPEIAKQHSHSGGVGLFGLETITTIDVTEIGGQAQALKNLAAEAHWFIGEHSHGHAFERGQAFAYAGIGHRVVQHVLAIVGEEKRQRLFAFLPGGARAERPFDQPRRSLANVAKNLIMRQRRAAMFLQRGIDGNSEINTGIDERAVEIENEDTDVRKRRGVWVRGLVHRNKTIILVENSRSPWPKCVPVSFNGLGGLLILLLFAAHRRQAQFMAEIFPFRAYRYNLDRVKLADVVTQPYDKITATMQARYATLSPYNLITVEKGKPTPQDSGTDNVYTRAEKSLEQWISEGVMARDSRPGLYVYFQEYTVPETTERRTRKGFIAAGRVEDYAARVVFRHELTHSGPKADRLELLRHTRTHTGQLFMLYRDPQRQIDSLIDEVAAHSHAGDAEDEYGVVHRVWPVFDAQIIDDIVRAMAPQKLVIADGHHRYETALAYRDECRAKCGGSDRNAPHEKAMMTFFNTDGEGLVILPTHRLVGNLPSFDLASFRNRISSTFDQEDYAFGSEAARSAAYERFRHDLLASGESARALGMYAGGTFTLLRLRRNVDLQKLMPNLSPAQRKLDVVLLHKLLLEEGLGITPAAVTAGQNVGYEREIGAAVDAVDRKRAQICFLLNPVGVNEVVEIALAGEVMPQKSTDFYPKLLSGLTLYRLD